MGAVYTVTPNRALIVSGGCCCLKKSDDKGVLIGRGCYFGWFLITNVCWLSLELITLNPSCQVGDLAVTAIVHCKVSNRPDRVLLAAEYLLGTDIQSTLLTLFEGHFAELISTYTALQVVKERKKLGELAQSVCAAAAAKFGVDVTSFLIMDVADSSGCLESVAEAQAAAVAVRADALRAEAEKESTMVEDNCRKFAECLKFSANSRMEDRLYMLKIMEQRFRSEVNALRSVADQTFMLSKFVYQHRMYSEQQSNRKINEALNQPTTIYLQSG